MTGNLEKLHDLLKGHDWCYEYCEDHSRWKRGSDQWTEILNLVDGPTSLALATQFVRKSPTPDEALAALLVASQRIKGALNESPSSESN